MSGYVVFISHNKADKQIAKKLGKHLLARNIDVWFDEWTIYAGDSLTDSIANGISRANVFLLIASENSMTSRWVHEELRIAIQKRMSDRDFKVITIKIDEHPLHPFLSDYLWIDYTNSRNFKSVTNKLVSSILKINQKPIILDIKSKFFINQLHYVIRFHGKRGATAYVSEYYDILALDDIKSIKKHIYHSGGLIEKNFIVESSEISGKLNIIERTTSLERLELCFGKTLPKDSNIKFWFDHTISNNFFNDDEFVYYVVESPTKILHFQSLRDRSRVVPRSDRAGRFHEAFFCVVKMQSIPTSRRVIA
ncbi:toll/interleukin-1 receptor domain-containing protein [Methyloglobulus sp.]|uniref:toll/interleukin-1 receptor domain-containing protein n=1 Tax=Methyloglobulus sp. TaxID=2518622 RepID=UPI00398A39B7